MANNPYINKKKNLIMKIRFVDVVFLWMCLCPLLAFPQAKATSKVLQEMVAQLPDIQLDKGAEGEFNLPSIVASDRKSVV